MISDREAAAQAARAAGREKATFEVIGRSLVRNGRRVKVGARIRLAQADAAVFLALGRLKPAKSKGAVAEDDADDASDSGAAETPAAE